MVLSQLMACMTDSCPRTPYDPVSTESSEEMPVTEDNETILKRLNIKTIDAQLIVRFRKRSQ